MKQPDFFRKPSLIAIFAFATIALLVFLTTGALLVNTNSLSDPDDILSMELNTLISQVKEYKVSPSIPETPETTPVKPESRSILAVPEGPIFTEWKWRP
jgi:hypothetical protein